MELTVKRALPADDVLVLQLRGEVMRDIHSLPPEYDLSAFEAEARRYFAEYKDQVTMLAYVDGVLAGCGSICFFDMMPTMSAPHGLWAYIMNMYTRPAYRRKGVASAVLRALLDVARANSIERLLLEATDEGRPVYEKLGFVQAGKEMEYKGKDD